MKRGLILGGGGVLGLAWEIGLLHGLCDAGIDLRGAHEVIGTSAGAFAGAALLDHRGIAWAYQRQIVASVREVAVGSSVNVIERLTEILEQCAGNDREAGRRIGAFSLETCMIDQRLRLAVVRERLDREDWPSGHLNFTAVDIDSGELHLLNRDSGIDLVHAAAASGAAPGIWPVVETRGRRWVDGGSVSVTNAYLASRFDECIVISPRPTNLSGVPVQAEIDGCGKRDSALLIVPDVRSEAAIGQNNFDPMRRRAAAEAGHQQGVRFASEIAHGWRAAPAWASEGGALHSATSHVGEA